MADADRHTTVSTTALALSARALTLGQTLELDIRRGRWGLGATIASTRQIAREHGVSLVTVRDALQWLEQRGLVERRPRRGVVVRASSLKSAVARPKAKGRPRRRDQARLTRQIAIVSMLPPRLASEESYGTRVHRSLEQAIASQGFELALVRPDLADPVASAAAQIERMGLPLVGVVVFNTPALHPLPDMLDELGLSWVTINRMAPQQMSNFVATDNIGGCSLAGECLAHMGIRRLLVLMAAGPKISQTETEKTTGLVQGYLRALAPINGIDYLITDTQAEFERAMTDYLATHEPPEAIFAHADQLAAWAMQVCRQRGLRVPADVKVLSGGGLELARHLSPSLSVVAQPMEELGQEAIRMIDAMIQNDVRRLPGRHLQSRFVLRQSLEVPDDILDTVRQRYLESIVL